MARYIDADKFREKSFYADTEADIVHYTRLYGYEDVIPKSEVEKVVAQITKQEMVSYEDVYKQEVARDIFEEINKVIIPALNSNYKARIKRLQSPKIEMADEFIAYCDGKISALRGIDDFITKLKKKYTESEDING